jgi:hypothetical protein
MPLMDEDQALEAPAKPSRNIRLLLIIVALVAVILFLPAI